MLLSSREIYFTDTVLRFSDGHIFAHWDILEAHTGVRDTNSDNIVKVILPDISVADGLKKYIL